ncbi:hypothetical protein ACIBAG_15235 [Streptomyces sp. NPDC051243]|uniref:hypothetical protein n=1 Tax=Streptomyces sp. NPDC051243 TaxID=3365646 RepID=UPI00379EB828
MRVGPRLPRACGPAALHLARAASLAPSPHKSQSWLFAEDGRDHGFEVHVHGGRRMMLTDPDGREEVIACGAALINVRIAVRGLGFRPAVDLLPEPGNSNYLAHVGYAAHAPATPEETRLARAMPRRHTHRGPFGPEPVPDTLRYELRDHARTEGADLRIIDEPEQLRLLADFVRAAEDRQRADPCHTAEIFRSVGRDGVPVEACRHHPDATLLAGRDYLGFARYYARPSRRWISRTGTVALLSTPYTQPLELPEPRAEIRTHLVGGRFPQLVLRLGRPPRTWCTRRRPPAEVLVHDGVPVQWSR